MASDTNLLDYAAPAAHRVRWGPIVPPLSRRTLVLLALTAAFATWLALRHEPWRLTCDVPAGSLRDPVFTPDGKLLTFDEKAGVNLYDPATGRLVRALDRHPATRSKYAVTSAGHTVVRAGDAPGVITLIDVATGTRTEVASPGAAADDLLKISPLMPRMLAHGPSHGFKGDYEFRDLAPSAGASTQPTPLAADAWWIGFSLDGERILTLVPERQRSARLNLVNGRTGVAIIPEIRDAELTHPEKYFLSSDWFLVPRAPNAMPTSQYTVDLYVASDGRRAGTLTLPAGGFPMFDATRCTISDDGRLLVHQNWVMTAAGPITFTLDVYDTATGATLYHDPSASGARPMFLPGSHNLLTVNWKTESIEVLDWRRDRAVALLRVPARPGAPMKVAGSGPWVVVACADGVGGTGGRLALYRRGGWDCPESVAGAIVFPQLWGAIASFLGLAISLAADARRGRPSGPNSPTVLALIVVATVLTLYTLLDACFGRFALWPAPVLLIASVGWVTGARFWRFTTIALLCAALAWALYLAGSLRSAGLGTGPSVTWNLLDRPHVIPVTVVWVALGSGAALAGLGLLLLPPRVQRP